MQPDLEQLFARNYRNNRKVSKYSQFPPLIQGYSVDWNLQDYMQCVQSERPCVCAHPNCRNPSAKDSQWVSTFLTVQKHNYACWFTLENTRQKTNKNTDNTKTKHNPEKANNTKYSKTKLSWFSHLIRHSARKWGGLNSTMQVSPHRAPPPRTAHHAKFGSFRYMKGMFTYA